MYITYKTGSTQLPDASQTTAQIFCQGLKKTEEQNSTDMHTEYDKSSLP